MSSCNQQSAATEGAWLSLRDVESRTRAMAALNFTFSICRPDRCNRSQMRLPSATAEVVASLNFDGSLVAFNFPRILSGPVSDDDLRNNSEIYVASIAPRPIGAATVLNAAAKETSRSLSRIAPGSIATIRGSALAFKTETATFAGE